MIFHFMFQGEMMNGVCTSANGSSNAVIISSVDGSSNDTSGDLTAALTADGLVADSLHSPHDRLSPSQHGLSSPQNPLSPSQRNLR